MGKCLVKVQKIPHIRAAPGVNGLIRVAHDEEVLVVAAEYLHEPVLDLVNVLKLVDHDVGKALLPLLADVRVGFTDVEGEGGKVVVVQS